MKNKILLASSLVIIFALSSCDEITKETIAVKDKDGNLCWADVNIKHEVIEYKPRAYEYEFTYLDNAIRYFNSNDQFLAPGALRFEVNEGRGENHYIHLIYKKKDNEPGTIWIEGIQINVN